MKSILRFLLVISITLLISVSVTPSSEDISASFFEDPLGTSYEYETYGSDFDSYESKILKIGSNSEVVFISTVLEGYEVKSISDSAMDANEITKTIVIPEKVKSIGHKAFASCTALETVFFMGDYPDYYSDSFPKDISINYLPNAEGWKTGNEIPVKFVKNPNGSQINLIEICSEYIVIGGVPFNGFMTIPSTVDNIRVSTIGPYSFSGVFESERTDIKEITIEDGISRIAERAFYYNTGISDIHFPDSLKIISDEAFRVASNLSFSALPSNLIYIGFEAMRECRAIESVNIPDSVEFIGEGCFKICTSLKDIELSEKLTTISKWCFAHDTNLESIKFGNNIKTIEENAFYMNHSLKSVSIPQHVSDIKFQAFYKCGSLSFVDMNEALISIGSQAFFECESLKTISIPENVSSIGTKAFAYSGLLDAYFAGSMPEFGSHVFHSTDVIVHCTEANKESWAEYPNVVVDYPNNNLWIYIGICLALVFAIGVIILIYQKRFQA